MLLDVTREGEFTALLEFGNLVDDSTWRAADREVQDLFAVGVVDFLFDLARVGRYETPALKALCDLWRRLNGLGCSCFVAAHNPGVIDCLHRVVPARGCWSLHPDLAAARMALLATPV